MPTEEQIRELAYSMWEKEGRPNGKDWEHYYTARRILEDQEEMLAHMGEDIAQGQYHNRTDVAQD